MSNPESFPLFVITSTWDSIGLIERFLEHQLNLGVDLIYVVDMGSTDGTLDILAQQRWGGSIHVHSSTDLTDLSPELTLEWARKHVGQGWCHLAEPDEFLIAPGNDLRSVLHHLDQVGVTAIGIPRFNMTASRATVQAGHLEGSDDFRRHLTYEIRVRQQRTFDDHHLARLEPPWIFSKIGPKVTFRIEKAVQLFGGGHQVEMAPPSPECHDHGLYFRHYPIRSFSEFEHKIRCAKLDLGAHPDLPPGFAWHWQRWVQLFDQGLLHEEYLMQFLDEDALPRLLKRGVVKHHPWNLQAEADIA